MYKAVLIQGHLASSGVAFESPLKKNVQSQTRMFLSITGTPDASPSPINHDIPIKQCIQYIYILHSITTSKPNFASPPSVIVQICIFKHRKTRTKPFPLPTVFTNLQAFKPHLCTACARREACKKQTSRHRHIDVTLYATEFCWNLPWSHPMKHP